MIEHEPFLSPSILSPGFLQDKISLACSLHEPEAFVVFREFLTRHALRVVIG